MTPPNTPEHERLRPTELLVRVDRRTGSRNATSTLSSHTRRGSASLTLTSNQSPTSHVSIRARQLRRLDRTWVGPKAHRSVGDDHPALHPAVDPISTASLSHPCSRLVTTGSTCSRGLKTYREGRSKVDELKGFDRAPRMDNALVTCS